jgi:hypothetical protein
LFLPVAATSLAAIVKVLNDEIITKETIPVFETDPCIVLVEKGETLSLPETVSK